MMSNLVYFIAVLLAAINVQATTYYVRVDGGSATQCTGKSNAAYPGSGSGQACAFNSPSIGMAKLIASDILYINSGTYKLSSAASIASGTSTARTKVLGASCSAPPKLVGIGGSSSVINIGANDNIEIGCLEITDNSDCISGHPTVGCSDSNYAKGGLVASGASNIWLHDVNIHGMSSRGIQAGALSNWTLDRVKINKNGRAGWEGTTGSNSGNMIFRNVEVGWNGCGEIVSTGAVHSCWAQDSGGYGDGLGTTTTGGKWLIEDSYFHHNTSDGLDLRYMDGADTTTVTIRRLKSVANAGNQAKIAGNVLIENSVLVGHCTYFRGKYTMKESELCRAYGSSLLLILTGNDNAVVRHNTIAGEGDVQIAYGQDSSTSGNNIYVQNNVVVGFPYYRDTSVYTLAVGGPAGGNKYFTGNMMYHTRSCPSGNICTVNPYLTNMTLASFDARPTSSSSLIDDAPTISAVTTDFYGYARPVGPASDLRAIEYGGAPVSAYTYSWVVGSWSACSATACGTQGTQSRTVQCKRNDGVVVADSYCTATKPATSQPCSAPACAFSITSGPSVVALTDTSADITWSLSAPGTGQIQYGKTTSYGSYSTLESSFNYSTHKQSLSGLSPGTLYHYRVISKNSSGVQVVSTDKTFTTTGGLVITSGPTVLSMTSSSATITWSLSAPATGQINYGSTTAYGNWSTKETSFNYSTHKQTLSNLKSKKLYYYRVISTDANGNTVTSAQKTFTTP